jgi:NAD(P)-dependent dehydrogenase (short-subunit alcohol dehydrogenase family)
MARRGFAPESFSGQAGHMAAKTWFITGASAGFGRRLTELLLERGDAVAATARQPAALQDLAGRYREQLWTAPLDVTDTQAIRDVVREAFGQHGRIDVVVSNAGYGLFGAAEELADEQIARQVATNLLGSIQLARSVLPHLRAQGGGRLIQLSSLGGQVAQPGFSLYHATKWGIEGFCEALTAEVAPFGIGVTLVEPAGARTDFGGRSMAMGDPIEAYASGPVGQTRAILTGKAGVDVTTLMRADPGKIARAIIDSADVSPAPRRLPLGGSAYQLTRAALKERIAELEAARDLACSVDVTQ